MNKQKVIKQTRIKYTNLSLSRAVKMENECLIGYVESSRSYQKYDERTSSANVKPGIIKIQRFFLKNQFFSWKSIT